MTQYKVDLIPTVITDCLERALAAQPVAAQPGAATEGGP